MITALVINSSTLKVCALRVTDETLFVELVDGRGLSVPLAWYPRLVHGTPAERNDFRFTGGGDGFHWPLLDEEISVESVLAGRASSENPHSFQRWLASRAVNKA